MTSFTNTRTVRIEWGDCDPAGIIFYPTYFKIFDNATAALFEAVRSKTIPIDASKGLGYQPPEVWEEWQKSMLATGELKAPLPDLTAAYTNDFVATWNKGLN